MAMSFRGGIGCDVWYNDAVVLLRINVTGLTAKSGDIVTDKIVLPTGVTLRGNMDINILISAMSNAWNPTGQIIYIAFTGSTGVSPEVRAIDYGPIDNVTLQGIYSLPRAIFTII